MSEAADIATYSHRIKQGFFIPLKRIHEVKANMGGVVMDVSKVRATTDVPLFMPVFDCQSPKQCQADFFELLYLANCGGYGKWCNLANSWCQYGSRLDFNDDEPDILLQMILERRWDVESE